jgi:hypothetical protein
MTETLPTLAQISDKRWRLTNLYFIIDKSGNKVLFDLNWAQKELYDNMWYKMVVLKARQLGITTFFTISFLDDCFWYPNTAGGIITHRREDSEEIFKKKVKYAYDNMPNWTRNFNSATNDRVGELAFKNGSSYRVSTGFRSGTYNRLLISEYGKICCKSPDVANEIMNGTLNAIADDQIVVLESTAEGREGHFYNICQQAFADQEANRKITKMQFKPFFFPWFGQDEYRLGLRNS